MAPIVTGLEPRCDTLSRNCEITDFVPYPRNKHTSCIENTTIDRKAHSLPLRSAMNRMYECIIVPQSQLYNNLYNN